jgi:hypothetical protein
MLRRSILRVRCLAVVSLACLAPTAIEAAGVQSAGLRNERVGQMLSVLTAIDDARPATLEQAERMVDLVERAEAPGADAADRRAAMTALYEALWRIRGLDVVTVQGRPLAAGVYTLFTIPGEREWTVIFNRVPRQFGPFVYDAAFDALRVTAAPREGPMREWFEIAATPAGAEATLVIGWDRVEVPLHVTVEAQ